MRASDGGSSQLPQAAGGHSALQSPPRRAMTATAMTSFSRPFMLSASAPHAERKKHHESSSSSCFEAMSQRRVSR